MSVLDDLMEEFGEILVLGKGVAERQVPIQGAVCCDETCGPDCTNRGAGAGECVACGRKVFFPHDLPADVPKFCKACGVANMLAAKEAGRGVKVCMGVDRFAAQAEEDGLGKWSEEALASFCGAIGSNRIAICENPDEFLKENEGKAVAVVGPVAAVPGYERRSCDTCWCPVWTTPDTPPEMRLLCPRCNRVQLPIARDRARREGQALIPVFTPAAFKGTMERFEKSVSVRKPRGN